MISDIIEKNKNERSKTVKEQQDFLRAQEIKSRVDFNKNMDVLKDYCRVE